MSFETYPLDWMENKRKKDDQEEDEEYLKLLEEAKELLKDIPSPDEIPAKMQKVEKPDTTEESPVSMIVPSWKEELQKKFDSLHTLEELDFLTKEIVKKNKPRKLPKKKLVRVENFYQRHCSGLTWMNNFLNRTKIDAVSRPYVERMLELENQFKKLIEEDELLGAQLTKED